MRGTVELGGRERDGCDAVRGRAGGVVETVLLLYECISREACFSIMIFFLKKKKIRRKRKMKVSIGPENSFSPSSRRY